ncbi:MAG: DUF3054 domain-containing protein [Nocardioidaceae bacterium]
MKWLPVDLVLVSVFAVIGRLSHGEAISPGGWWRTAWPFLTGVLVGWVLVLVARRAGGAVSAGAIVWACTLVGGMLLRRASEQGTATPFVIVAAVVLGLFLVGSRFSVGRLS